VTGGPPRPRVVILGAGFAGLTLARSLGRARVDVTLVDRNNYHLFTPLLYQVASSLLDPSEIAQPVRSLVRRVANCEFLLGTVTSVDLDARLVVTDRGPIGYDYLVVATGSRDNHFGNRSLEERSLSLKELPNALAIRNWVLGHFERWRWATDPAERERLLTFAVIGGGPTGVEYAGALEELIAVVRRKDFRHGDRPAARVVLIEGANRLLGMFDSRLGAAAARSLRAKGVEVWTGVMVSELRPEEVELSDGRILRAGTVIWTAGVRGSEVGSMLGVPTDRQGRVPVTESLRLPSRGEVFVIGDLAGREGLPMLAQPAMQEARHTARNIAALVAGRPAAPFSYRDPGIMATIGRYSAVAQIGGLRLTGLPGWAVWLVVHLFNIVTLRARLAALTNWAWDYLFLDRPVRILVRASEPPESYR
jgi:NADH dehydrogenase